MFTIYLAVAHEGLEKFLKSNKALIEKKMETEVNFVGTAVYREGIIQGIKDYHPDVVLIREGIPGSLSLTDLIYKIKFISPETRVIFLAGNRVPGDAFLATLVQYGVYDILIGSKVNAKDMIKKILYPNKLADVIELMPKVSVDETTNKQIYESPDVSLLHEKEENDDEIPVKPMEQLETVVEEQPIPNPIVIDNKKSNKKELNLKVEKDLIEQEPIIPKVEEVVPISLPEVEKVISPQSIKETVPDEDEPIFVDDEEDEVVKNETTVIQDDEEEPVFIEDDEDEIKVSPIQINQEKQPILEEDEIKESISVVTPSPVPNRIVQMQNKKQEVKTTPITVETTKPIVVETVKPIEEPVVLPQVEPLPVIQNTIPTTENIPPIDRNPYKDNTPGKTQMLTPDLNPNPQDFNPMFTPRYNQSVEQNTQQKKGGLFGKKGNQKTIAQQIVTFVGGRNGCGNSQIAFNVGLSLAEQGYKVLYLDLNENFSSIDSVLEFGLEDLGVDTMLQAIATGNYPVISQSIASSAKILQNADKKDSVYKIYNKFPTKYEFACFSIQYMYKDKKIDIDKNLLKELNMFLLMNFNYDVIIIDAPSDYKDLLTKSALVYSNRIIFTLTQDYSDLECFMRNMRYIEQSKIGYKDKCNFVLNKYQSHTDMEIANLTNYLQNNLRFDNFRILTVPNVSVDMINATNSFTPVLFKAKDKIFRKSIADITHLIMS